MIIQISQFEIFEWSDSWPCSGLSGHSMRLEFDDKRNLTDYTIRHLGKVIDAEEFNGSALCAIIDDARDGLIGREVL